MINKQTLLIEIWCTLISLKFYLFQINSATLSSPKWVLFRLKRFLLEVLLLVVAILKIFCILRFSVLWTASCRWSWLATLRSFCFSIFCMAVSPVFTFSDFDTVGCGGFCFWRLFVSHCYFLRHRAFWFWMASTAKCCFIFWLKMDWEESETSQTKTCIVFWRFF